MVKAEDVLTNDQTFFKTKDGTIARKGTIAAAILNANYIEELLKQPQSATREAKLKSILQDIHSLLPGLNSLNLFQFFTPIEWLQESPTLKEGRVVIAVLFLQRHPELVNSEIIARLKAIKSKTSLETKLEIDKLVNDHSR